MPTLSRRSWFPVVAVAVALVAAWPLMSTAGLLNTRGGGDSPFLLQRLHQLVTAVADGHFPVRWMPDANYGYGYPFYNFYAPLSIYIAALFRFAGWSYTRSLQLAQLSGFIVAAITMYWLAARWFKSAWAGLLASVAYTVAPFHLVNIYVRGDSLAEFWAMAFYPAVVLAVDRLFACPTAAGRWRAAGVLAALYAALILSHNISALIFSPFLLLYIGWRWLIAYRRNTGEAAAVWRMLLPVGGGLLLALGLSAWFFLPALVEKDLAQLSPVTEGYFHFSNHFLGVSERPLSQMNWLFNYSPEGLTAFRMGLLQTIAISLGVVVLLWPRLNAGRPQVERRLFILLSLGISTFMLLPLATALWTYLPLLSFTQFPWRFLSVQAFAGALAIGALGLLPRPRLVVPLAAGLLIVASLGGLETDHLPLTDADVTSDGLAQYEWFTGNIGTTVSAEYLPQTVVPRMATSAWLNRGTRDIAVVQDGTVKQAQLLERQSDSQQWQIEATEPSTLILPTIYWPGWEARSDEEPLIVTAAPGSGLIQVTVPAGKQILTLELKRTPVRILAELLSLTALVLLLWSRRPARSWRPGRSWLVGVALLLLLTIAPRLWPEPPLPTDTLTWDFAQMAYLHASPDGIAFSDAAQLVNYRYSSERLGPGEILSLNTTWRGVAAGTEVSVWLETPASHRVRSPSAPTVAQATVGVNGDTAELRLNIPDDVPDGLYIPRLALAGHWPLTPSGLRRGDLYLRPLQIANSGAAIGAARSLDVRVEDVQQRDGDVIDIQLAWQTAVPLSENLNVALRLTDADGQYLQLADQQPGYGFQPSSLWPPQRWTNDWLALSLPAGEHPYPYRLVGQLVDVADPLTPLLTRPLGELSPQAGGHQFVPYRPQMETPAGLGEMMAVFEEAVALRAYALEQTADTLRVNLLWQALAPSSGASIRFVQLIPAGGGPPAAQVDSFPHFDSYPASLWSTGEFVEDLLQLELQTLPSGAYEIVIGFYERRPDGALPRATAVGSDGAPLVDNVFRLPELITVP